MAVLVQDDFNRANNSTVLGSPVVGPAPTILTGTFGINSNQAYASVMGINGAIAVYECGTANVDIRFKKSVTNQGSLVFGANSATDFFLAFWTSDTNSFQTEAGIGRILNGQWQNMLKAKQGPSTATTSSVLKFIHYNGFCEMWSDSQLLLRGGLPETVTGTKHGIRPNTTGVFFDDLLIQDAADISYTRTGNMREPAWGTMANPPKDVFVYRGRDTKTQDTTGAS